MKKAIILLIVLGFCLGLALPAFAADEESQAAAEELYELGLFSGVGTNEDGTPDFDLDREPTRNEAVTMLVRLLGKEEEALAGTWDTPFTDVAGWAKPYVGYAYANGLTKGTEETTFGGSSTVSATQYLTFVLRAMGYVSGTDFQWNRAWELSDAIGMTDGRYNADSGSFLRGDVAIISWNALRVPLKGGSETLLEYLGLSEEAEPKAWYETDEKGNLFIRTNLNADSWNGFAILLRWKLSNGMSIYDCEYGKGFKAVYRLLSSLSWMCEMPAGTTIVRTDITFFNDSSVIDTIYKQMNERLDYEERVDQLCGYVAWQFSLDNQIRMEEKGSTIRFTSFSLEQHDNETETYTAYIDGEISPDGEYGLVFRVKSGSQLHGYSYIRRAEGYLTFTRGHYGFGESGTEGYFYLTHCTHRMEENGDIVFQCVRSNELLYKID
ncbi:MAG: S-layer homology domain-containing protein [Clostridiales bacterium]|nr:S-layer homology domain-containing protein [Clostridiales bacterium]